MLSVFCNNQRHMRSKPIDGVIIVELGILKLYYHLKNDFLAFRHCYVTISIKRPIIKKNYVTCKNALNALCEKRLQSSMFKWTSLYNFLEFHCKKNSTSYAIYHCKKMVKILNCHLYAKKVMALFLRVQFFLANPVYLLFFRIFKGVNLFLEFTWHFIPRTLSKLLEDITKGYNL